MALQPLRSYTRCLYTVSVHASWFEFFLLRTRQIAADSLTVTPFLGFCLRLAPSWVGSDGWQTPPYCSREWVLWTLSPWFWSNFLQKSSPDMAGNILLAISALSGWTLPCHLGLWFMIVSLLSFQLNSLATWHSHCPFYSDWLYSSLATW